MASSVSVDDNIRKRIKVIAAKLDTSQGDVVAMGIELLENKIEHPKVKKEHPAREIMRKAIKNNPALDWRKKIRKKLESPGPQIEDVMISSWGEIDEN